MKAEDHKSDPTDKTLKDLSDMTQPIEFPFDSLKMPCSISFCASDGAVSNRTAQHMTKRTGPNDTILVTFSDTGKRRLVSFTRNESGIHTDVTVPTGLKGGWAFILFNGRKAVVHRRHCHAKGDVLKS